MSVDLTVEGAVAKVVLNRPEKLNALNVEMRESLCEYFARLRYDDAVRVVIVTGAGRGFCSGADVDRMAGQHHDLRGGRQRLQQGGHTFIRALHAIEKPVIAAVRGPAVGIGWSIALACDLVVASKTARFSQIFRRIGLAPDGGAIWFLTRRLGMAKAKELVFSARFVEAEEALALGLVNHVVEDDQLMAKTEALAADLAEAPTFALGLAKKLFHAAVGPSLDEYLDIESLVQPQLHMTADNAEGVAAFREKRRAEIHRPLTPMRCARGAGAPWTQMVRGRGVLGVVFMADRGRALLNALRVDADLDPGALLLQQHRRARVALAPAAVQRLGEFRQRQIGDPHRYVEIAAELGGERHILVRQTQRKGGGS